MNTARTYEEKIHLTLTRIQEKIVNKIKLNKEYIFLNELLKISIRGLVNKFNKPLIIKK